MKNVVTITSRRTAVPCSHFSHVFTSAEAGIIKQCSCVCHDHVQHVFQHPGMATLAGLRMLLFLHGGKCAVHELADTCVFLYDPWLSRIESVQTLSWNSDSRAFAVLCCNLFPNVAGYTLSICLPLRHLAIKHPCGMHMHKPSVRVYRGSLRRTSPSWRIMASLPAGQEASTMPTTSRWPSFCTKPLAWEARRLDPWYSTILPTRIATSLMTCNAALRAGSVTINYEDINQILCRYNGRQARHVEQPQLDKRLCGSILPDRAWDTQACIGVIV